MKIPRAHPVYPVTAESASVASDTIPSDYPSETPSEAEQVHTNQAFILEEAYHSEGKKLEYHRTNYMVRIWTKRSKPFKPFCMAIWFQIQWAPSIKHG